MAEQQFRFPDETLAPEELQIVIEGRPDAESERIDTSGNPPVVEAKPEKQPGFMEVEVLDDRPEGDREKQKSKPPMELTDEELGSYGEKVRKRLQHFSKGYHDQRRAAEEAGREKEEALRLTHQLVEENRKLKGTVGNNQKVLLEQAKVAINGEVQSAKQQYKQAYEAGDADAVLAAQEALTTAKLREQQVNSFKLPPLQDSQEGVQNTNTAPKATVDQKAVNWQKDNQWFGPDDEMTSFALGLHQKLVKQGVNPQSDDYYGKINSRMREVFPDKFSAATEDSGYEVEVEEPRRKANVVAPVTRSVAPRKITLTRTQVALAKRLGVPLEEYAKQVAIGATR
jgi:hypothetical protein